MRRYIKYIALVAVIFGVLIAAGCNTANKGQKLAAKNYNSEQLQQQQALNEQIKTTPVEYPAYSDERANINERNIRLNDPNKITYVYGIALDGSVIFHDTAKGKVSGCDSQILPEEGPIRYRGNDLVVPQPEPDGSFGTNGNCIFYFTTQGAYREWEGNYFMSDQPITIRTPVKFVANLDASITKSIHAKKGNDK